MWPLSWELSVIKTKLVPAKSMQSWFLWCKTLLDLYQTEKQFIVNEIRKTSHFGLVDWILAHELSAEHLLMRNLLLDAIMSADKSVPGSGAYVPWFIYNSLPTDSPKRKSSEEYLSDVTELTKNTEAIKLFRSIYDVSGPLTKLIVKPSFDKDVVLKYRNAFGFKLALDPQFHRIIGENNFIDLTNPIVIMIEGAPQTVAEINSLLQWNHEYGRPVLLIARNFPEEVSATLASNWLRGSLSVLPIQYGNTLDTINLAADICAITKGELISNHFGDVISASVLDEDKWGSIDRLEWSAGILQIYKDVDVSSHIKSLLKRMDESEEEDLKKIFRDRILSLSNDALEVWVPKEELELIRDMKEMIKHYNAFVLTGSVNTNIGNLPVSFVESAGKTALSLRKRIDNTGGYLVNATSGNMVS